MWRIAAKPRGTQRRRYAPDISRRFPQGHRIVNAVFIAGLNEMTLADLLGDRRIKQHVQRNLTLSPRTSCSSAARKPADVLIDIAC